MQKIGRAFWGRVFGAGGVPPLGAEAPVFVRVITYQLDEFLFVPDFVKSYLRRYGDVRNPIGPSTQQSKVSTLW